MLLHCRKVKAARKPANCVCCDGVILVGESCYDIASMGDDGFWHGKECMRCGWWRDDYPSPHVARCAKSQARVDVFNREYPVGTPVRYWPVRHEDGSFDTTWEPREGMVRGVAYVNSAGGAVVFVTGITGCVSISHLEPLTIGRTA